MDGAHSAGFSSEQSTTVVVVAKSSTNVQSANTGSGDEGSTPSMVASKSTASAVKGERIVDPKKAMRFQLVWTLLGSIVLFACITIMGVVWLINYQHTASAVETISVQFRSEQARAMSIELAQLMRPCFALAVRFAHQLEYTDLKDKLTRPSFYSDHDKLSTDFYPLIYPSVTRNTNTRSWNADGSSPKSNDFIGIVAALALDDKGNVTSELKTCSKSVFATLVLPAPGTPRASMPDAYDIDNQKLKADGSLERNFHNLDLETCSVGEVLPVPIDVLPCPIAVSSISLGHRPSGTFEDFSWFGPFNPQIGWGNHLEGCVPLRGASNDIVGRLCASISLGLSVGPLLSDIIMKGGDLTKGGSGAVYTSSGMVVGLSESAASPTAGVQANLVEAIVPDSDTGRALAIVKARTGQVCPETQVFIDEDDVLVDVTPFYTEPYGMAPLEERWCQLMIVPRENVFEAVDESASSGIAVGVTAGAGFLLSAGMLIRSLVLTYNAYAQMNRERKRRLRDRVVRAESFLGAIGVPMSIMRADIFLAMEKLECHEDCRDAGRLTVLDSVDQVYKHQSEGNVIALYSHQWLSYQFPDNDEKSQTNAMKMATKQIIDMESEKTIYIWLDYISVAQRHAGMMKLAINSLPTYVSLVDYFVIIAPDAQHKDTGLQCDLDTYSRRGWCRTEMLAKACSSGIHRMYICSGSGGQLQTYVQEDFNRVSLKVFEGDFTVRTDMESLVEPVLGLYGSIIRQSEKEDHLNIIRAEMDKDKDSFFPKTYQPELRSVRKKVLFGQLVDEMEEWVGGPSSRRISDESGWSTK